MRDQWLQTTQVAVVVRMDWSGHMLEEVDACVEEQGGVEVQVTAVVQPASLRLVLLMMGQPEYHVLPGALLMQGAAPVHLHLRLQPGLH